MYPPQGFLTAALPSKPLEATVFVAASDARPEVKALADFVCTGTNDDVTIENAINALPTVGGKIKLSEGTFIFNSSLDILRSNITLEGSGPGTKIFLADETNTNIIVVGSGNTALSNIKICNLLIDGNKDNQSGDSQGILFNGSSESLITDSVIENCWIKNCRNNGIYLSFSNNNIIIGNNCQSNDEDGIYLNICNNNIIIGNNCQSNAYYGIYLDTNNNIIVIGNNCQSNGEFGIVVDGSPNNTITGNDCRLNGVEGIYLVSSDNNTIIGNNCQFNGLEGIHLDGSNNNTITSNNCESNGQDGIYLFSSNNNTITSNNCELNNYSGIYLYNSSNNIITGNILKDNSQLTDNTFDDIYVNGNSNIISNNIMIATERNKTSYGVNEDGGDHNIIMGNYFSGQVTGNIKLVGLNSIAMGNLEG